jgi:hypothetical protein
MRLPPAKNVILHIFKQRDNCTRRIEKQNGEKTSLLLCWKHPDSRTMLDSDFTGKKQNIRE